MSSEWFKVPDQVGGWKTRTENQTNCLLSPMESMIQGEGGGFNSDFNNDFRIEMGIPGFDINWITNPLDYQINDLHQQYYCVGQEPVGGDLSPRALIGVDPYG